MNRLKLMGSLGKEKIRQRISLITLSRERNYRRKCCGKYHFQEIMGNGLIFNYFLRDTRGKTVFMDFLRTEFSEENLEFWNACEEFSNLDDVDGANHDAVKEIYSTYIAPGSPKEINLSSDLRQNIQYNMDYPTKHLFFAAQKHIEGLMEKDSFTRFTKQQLCFKSTVPS
ncbi:regulator of G-protein signaling 21-like [Pecten maximus]|uniref:regulator of G-protein signaling 21-like n=1 Tax=Pecten maximus TaxID=6579 RepID=UPI001458FEDD|nr:regulator of G-protein signaling 21-like [Pecten maximus]